MTSNKSGGESSRGPGFGVGFKPMGKVGYRGESSIDVGTRYFVYGVIAMGLGVACAYWAGKDKSADTIRNRDDTIMTLTKQLSAKDDVIYALNQKIDADALIVQKAKVETSIARTLADKARACIGIKNIRTSTRRSVPSEPQGLINKLKYIG